MIAVWILLALAVLFGGAILALTVYAVRHDNRRADTPKGGSPDDAEARG